MKKPHIADPVQRGLESCKTVSEVMSSRPWVTGFWETQKNSELDHLGFDMFANVKSDFLSLMNLSGVGEVLPIQIKSSDKRANAFVKKYADKGRFFGTDSRYHQMVLCGMDEHELVLADIVGQMVVHGMGFQLPESVVVSKFAELGDMEAVKSYKKFKVVLLFRWYGLRLPPL